MKVVELRNFIGRYSYNIVALIAGILLLVAAVLKYIEARRDTVTPTDWLLIFGEIMAGGWILSGLAKEITRICGAVLFFVLFNVATLKYSQGMPTCGCFGAVRTDPRIIALIDGLLVCGFILARPGPRLSSADGNAILPKRVRATWWTLPITVVIVAATAVMWKVAVTERAAAVVDATVHEIAGDYAAAQKRSDTIRFRSEWTVENKNFKEFKAQKFKMGNTTVTVTSSPRTETQYDYWVSDNILRRDRVAAIASDQVCIWRDGVGLQYELKQSNARMRRDLNFEGLPVDPRCFGLPLGVDSMTRFLAQMRADGVNLPDATTGQDAVVVAAHGPREGRVELTLSRRVGYQPTRVICRTMAGLIESASRLDYAPTPGGGWYLADAVQHLYGEQQPKEVLVDDDKVWVTRVKYRILVPPTSVGGEEAQRQFSFKIPAGVVVADAISGAGFKVTPAETALEYQALSAKKLAEVKGQSTGKADARTERTGSIWTLIIANLSLGTCLLVGWAAIRNAGHHAGI